MYSTVHSNGHSSITKTTIIRKTFYLHYETKPNRDQVYEGYHSKLNKGTCRIAVIAICSNL